VFFVTEALTVFDLPLAGAAGASCPESAVALAAPLPIARIDPDPLNQRPAELLCPGPQLIDVESQRVKHSAALINEFHMLTKIKNAGPCLKPT
jgi:hypothetical protein